MENLELYNAFAGVPENAKKPIQAGKLKGKTDINPMWRIKTLTAAFGPCGFGWTTKITEHWIERDGGESSAWVRLELRVKVDGQWSEPIEGIGGSKQFGKGQGDGINDEAFKMAETDAISVACKKLGMGADVYWQAHESERSTGKGGNQERETNYYEGNGSLRQGSGACRLGGEARRCDYRRTLRHSSVTGPQRIYLGRREYL